MKLGEEVAAAEEAVLAVRVLAGVTDAKAACLRSAAETPALSLAAEAPRALRKILVRVGVGVIGLGLGLGLEVKGRLRVP